MRDFGCCGLPQLFEPRRICGTGTRHLRQSALRNGAGAGIDSVEHGLIPDISGGRKAFGSVASGSVYLPNHLNPLILATSLNVNSALFGVATADQSGIAGQISGTTSGDYRVIQFALKLMF